MSLLLAGSILKYVATLFCFVMCMAMSQAVVESGEELISMCTVAYLGFKFGRYLEK